MAPRHLLKTRPQCNPVASLADAYLKVQRRMFPPTCTASFCALPPDTCSDSTPHRHTRAGAAECGPSVGQHFRRTLLHGITRSSSARCRRVTAGSGPAWHRHACHLLDVREKSQHADTPVTLHWSIPQKREASLPELPQSTRRRRGALLTARGACHVCLKVTSCITYARQQLWRSPQQKPGNAVR